MFFKASFTVPYIAVEYLLHKKYILHTSPRSVNVSCGLITASFSFYLILILEYLFCLLLHTCRGVVVVVVVVVSRWGTQTMDEETRQRIVSYINEELGIPTMRHLGDREYDLGVYLRGRDDKTSVVDKFVEAMGERASQLDEPDRSRIIRRVHMHSMLLKSCFVIELFRKYAMEELRDPHDPIFNTPEKLHEVRCDLISMCGEYPPFFALVEFFNATKIQDDPRDNLIDLALHFFEDLVGHPLKPSPNNPIQIPEIRHLVDLLHKALSVPVAAEAPITMEMDTELYSINHATELQKAGVKFKRMEGYNLEIKFQNGVLEIPPIKVAKNTTLFLLQRLMEYEQHSFLGPAPRNVNDYVKFIQCLINSPKDVALLRHGGIIENWLSNAKRSRIIGNWLSNDKLIFDELMELSIKSEASLNFTYSGIFKKVNEHCQCHRSIWMANLWRNYLNSPWSWIGFLVAVVSLLLALTQTVFSILTYHPS